MRKEHEETEVGTIVAERKAFDHQHFSVVQRVVRMPNGTVRDPQLLWDRGGRQFAVVVAIDKDNNVILVEEPKYGQMRLILSAPTGGVKKDEDPLVAAKREFLDETGYGEGLWLRPPTMPIVDFADKSDGGGHLLFPVRGARKLQEPKNPEQKVVLLPWEGLLPEIKRGRIPAMSIAALTICMTHLH